MSEKVVRQCKRTWRRIGVSREDGAEMAGELAADLRVALADGRDPQSYVGGDPAGFARAWASERGVVPLRYRTGRLMAASLLGALPGLFAGLFMVFGTSSDELEQVLGRTVDVPTWLVMILYTASAVFVWAGVLAAVSAVLRFHADAARRATVGALAVLLPFFAVAAVVGTAMVARLYGYPYGLAVVAEVTAPLSIMTGLVGVTRVVIVRRFRPSAEPAGSLWDAVPA